MTAKIFRNAFLIGFTVLLACILLFFFIMYSNYQAQAFDNLAIEAEHISEGMQICGGESYLSAVQSGERITWIAADGSVKIPIRIVPALNADRAAGGEPIGAERAVAAWTLHLRGVGAPFRDANAAAVAGLGEGTLEESVDKVCDYLKIPDPAARASILALAKELEAKAA